MSLAADTRIAALVCGFGAAVALVVLHMLLARVWLGSRPEASPQKFTAGLALLINLPMLAALLAWPGLNLTADLAWAGAWAALFYNAVAYSYFHWFNLSETGRRIRLLLQLLDAGGTQVPLDQLSVAGYDGASMVDQRLDRLHQMGQAASDGVVWRIRGRVLLRIGRFVHGFGALATRRAGMPPGPPHEEAGR